jgi:hypothetical protein
MKKTVFFLSVFSIGIVAISMQRNSKLTNFTRVFSHSKNTIGAPIGKTGAPGETNCTSCHGGSTLDGNLINTVTVRNASLQAVTSYIAGTSYNVTLEMSATATKRGFQLVALAGSSNLPAGTVTGNATAGSQTAAGTGALSARTYVTHTSAGTASSLGWGFTWVAPATGLGPVTFYVATNKTDNSGTSAGDQIYLSTKVISEAGASLSENKVNQSNFAVVYSISLKTLDLTFNALSVDQNTLLITDMNGKTIHFSKLGENEIGFNKLNVKLDENLTQGMYNVTLMFGNTPLSKKIMVVE